MNRRKFLLASVLALQNLNFIYPSCQKCFSRIILVSKRSNCPKCGSTGEAENANYRYKLSLKVAESNKLFVITVFGSCLDTFFGLSATDLHRYIQDPNKIPETLGSDTIQNLLTKAVETCFIGQNFIFGVTNFEKQCGQGSDSSNFLQQCHDLKREARALVACQIVLPDPSVAGFTVIDYFHQLLQTCNLRKLHFDPQESSSHSLALDHSDSDLGSIHGSESTFSVLGSHSRNNFSRFWQPSLELTSTVSQLRDGDDISASEQSMAIGTLHQNKMCIPFAQVTGSSSSHDPIQDSWSLISYMDKKSTVEKLDEELSLQANQPKAVHSSPLENGVTNFNLFPLKIQEPFESSNVESFHSAVKIKNRYSQSELQCYQHHDIDTTTTPEERFACFPPSPLRPKEIASSSQDSDPMIWDDLPFSESLNKFLAVIENEIPITQTDARSSNSKHDRNDDISKFHAGHSRLSVTPYRSTGALHTPSRALRLSQAAVIANASKDKLFSNCEANSSTIIQKESQPANTAQDVSISSNGSHISEYFQPDTYVSPLFSSSKHLEKIVNTDRSLSHRDEISLRPSTSENDQFCLSLKYFNDCGEKSLSEVNEKWTTLCSRRYSDLCKLENKQNYRRPKIQGDSFKICRKLTYPLENLCSSPSRNTDTLKEISYGHINNNLTQSYSAGHEGSYNASADLFDDITKEMDITREITKKSQDILLQWETSMAENLLAESDFSPRSLSENLSQPSQKLSLQSISASRYLRTYSPPPHFQSDSQYDLEDSQDFVPCSQSTPVAGFHQRRIHGIKGAFQKLPAFYSDLHANFRKGRISPKNDKQQAIPSCPKHITPSQKFRSPIISAITRPEVFNYHTISERLETDADEWVPPTTKKVFVSDMLGLQVMGLKKCFTVHNSPHQKEFPKKKLKLVKQRTNLSLIKKKLNMFTAIGAKQETPKYDCKRSDWISKASVLGLAPVSEVRCCLPSSENCPPSVSETKSAWSPELFTQKVA